MRVEYSKVSSHIIEQLREIAGADNVSASQDDLERYSRDEMPVSEPHPPELIVKPVDTTAVAQILNLANENHIPVTPRGAGTGVVGGCIPIYGGIVLSLERMNQILEIDEDNFVAVVEPGVILADLYQAAEEHGLYYPLYPGESTASLGGNIATNAGGMRAVKYGVTRHFVLGLEAVLPTGEVVNTGGKFVKSSTGYDLTQLIVGSEGTLAVVTKIILRLISPPKRSEVLLIPFARLEDAIRSVPQILKQRVLPVGLEFMERDIVHIAEKYVDKEIPFHDCEAFLLIIVEGDSEEEILGASSVIADVCKNNGAIETYVPSSERAKRDLMETRGRFYPAAKSTGPLDAADIVVPRSMIPKFVGQVKEISQQHQIPMVAYGHAGDGNVHVHPLSHGIDEEQWRTNVPQVLKNVYQAGAALGGMVSGEHGIGFDKKAYLGTSLDEDIIALMKRVKKAFDPNNILNPGKLFDLE